MVASNIAGIPGLVADGREGLLVPPNDVGALAKAIERLLRDAALRERMSKGGSVALSDGVYAAALRSAPNHRARGDRGRAGEVFHVIKRQGGTARVVVVTNMVTPYTDRLYNALVASGLDISIVACVSREPNRRWEIDRSTYPLAVLSGWVLKLGTGRYAHVSRGLGKVLSQLKPDLVFINGFYPTMVFAAFWARFRGVKLASDD